MAPQSAAVSAGDDATATNYNSLRNDTLLGLKVVTAVTDAATMTIDLSLGNIFSLGPITTDRTIAVSDETTDQFFLVYLTQDGTGSHTVTWFSTITWLGTGGAEPVPSTAGNAVDIFLIRVTGSSTYHGWIVSQG